MQEETYRGETADTMSSVNDSLAPLQPGTTRGTRERGGKQRNGKKYKEKRRSTSPKAGRLRLWIKKKKKAKNACTSSAKGRIR